MLQGYRFGRPSSVEDLALHHEPSDTTALLRLGANPNGRIATKRDLLHMSRHVESGVLTADCVLLSALQHADHLSWRTRRQYRALARRCGFVGMVGVDLSRAGGNELSGVRTADLRADDPMTANWWVIAMSPTTSIGLLATEIQPDPAAGPVADMERLFSYRFISDPGEVENAARALLRYF